jgi:HEAT repeat protein
MMSMELSPFEESLAELRGSSRLMSYSCLLSFSDMSPEELMLFKDVWTGIDARRRYNVLSRMASLVEERVELNFHSVMECCLADPDEKLRAKAIEGLWENRHVSQITRLISLLRQDKAAKVRAAAATALGKFAMMAELQELRQSYVWAVSNALLAAFHDRGESLEVRRRALEAIAPMSLPEVAGIIQEAYRSRNAELKASAIYAMGQNCSPAWLPLLQEELNSPDPEIRFEAAGACGELGEEDAVPSLIVLLSDSDIQVRLAAIETLGRIGGEHAKTALLRCLQDPDGEVSQAAVEALEEIEANEGDLLFEEE